MFRMRMLVVALAIGVSATAVACSLLTSLDGFSTGPAAVDGGVDAPGVAPSSVGDAGASDADAGDAGRFCDRLSPPAQLCDDFDDVGPFTKWNVIGVPSPTATRDTNVVRSPPNALLVTTPGGTTTPQSSYLRYVVPAAVGKLHVAYDVRIDTHGSYAEVGYVWITSATITQAYYFRLGTSGTPVSFTAEARLSDGGIPQHDVALAGSPLFDAWTHVNLDIDLVSPTRTATVRIDGPVAATATLEPELFSTGTTEVVLGIGYTSSGSTTWRVRYDNATVGWE